MLNQHSAFEEQEIWKLSTEFGAECEYELSDRTTHLISNRVDTEKALESRERGIPAVKPDWIYSSCQRWERLDWKEFELKIVKTYSKKRSLADLANDEDEETDVIESEIPFLNEEDLEEIQKELEDLESSGSEGKITKLIRY